MTINDARSAFDAQRATDKIFPGGLQVGPVHLPFVVDGGVFINQMGLRFLV